MKLKVVTIIILLISGISPVFGILTTNSSDFAYETQLIDFTNVEDAGGLDQSDLNIGFEVNETIIWLANPGGVLRDSFGQAAFGENSPAWDFRNPGRDSFSASAIDHGNTVYMEYVFSNAPVAEVGGFINYTTGSGYVYDSTNMFITVIGTNANVLESYNLIDVAPITGGGDFRGIAREQNDIARLRLASDGRFFALDDLQFSRIPPPVKIHSAIELEWISISGLVYQIQWSTNLSSDVWYNFGDPIIGDGSTNYVLETTRGRPKRFFRVEYQ